MVLGSGEKWAVVGRSGAATSTLAALTRMEAAESGKILLDGVDMAGLGLRGALSAVSQERVSVAGTVWAKLGGGRCWWRPWR